MRVRISTVILAVLFNQAIHAQYQLHTVASGLTQPVGLSHAGDARMFIFERAGRIKVLRPDGVVAPQLFLNITDRVLSTSGEQGLLGLAFDPEYPTTGRFYVYYTAGSGGGVLRLSRFQVSEDPNVALPASEQILWQQAKSETNHNGGCVRFGPDGYLYIAPGDGGGGGDPDNNSQNMAVAFGKMLRFDVSGVEATIPPGNPFVGQGGILPEIWASGLRNPWRFSFDRQTGNLWIADVGQDAQEEIDMWPAGDNSGPNFGWRCYEGTVPYNTSGCQPQSSYVDPVFVHQQSDGSCSISGGVVYRGSAFPALQGRYIYTDQCHGRVYGLHAVDHTAAMLMSTGAGGTVSVDEDVAGEVYFVRMNAGIVARLVDAGAQVLVAPKVMLAGAYDPQTALMRDDLRATALIPSTEPYSELGFAAVGNGGGETVDPGVLGTTGPDAVVDWVRVELRSTLEPAVVIATRHGLVQRDGDVVAADGVSPIAFMAGAGTHFVAVRHRNHMGVMTAAPVALTSSATALNFTLASTATWGAEARTPINGIMALWPGNTTGDKAVAYTGTANDRDPILSTVGGSVPTNTETMYDRTDVNLDGNIRYTGEDNDRDLILQTIGGAVPTSTVSEQLP